jgi:hypothetical protein
LNNNDDNNDNNDNDDNDDNNDEFGAISVLFDSVLSLNTSYMLNIN